MPILATENTAPASEMILDYGDLLYCFDCQDWHCVPNRYIGKAWSTIIEQGHPVGRPCGLDEAIECIRHGQNMSAKGFPGFVFIPIPRDRFAAVTMTAVVRQPGIAIHEGELQFGPCDSHEFRKRIGFDQRIFVPWTPVLLG